MLALQEWTVSYRFDYAGGGSNSSSVTVLAISADDAVKTAEEIYNQGFLTNENYLIIPGTFKALYWHDKFFSDTAVERIQKHLSQKQTEVVEFVETATAELPLDRIA